MSTTSPPTPEWVHTARRHIWQPYTQMQNARPPIPIARADGVYFFAADGRRYLDGISSWWVNIHGHNHPRLNAALAQQAGEMAHVMSAGFTHEPAARLAAELARRAPGDLPHVFYSDDGSTAVEAALKMAYQYWRYRGDKRRDTFVSLENAYHGDTFGAMAVGDVSVFHAEFSDLFFRVRRIPTRLDPSLESDDPLDRLLAEEGDRVAAVIIEPMLQGAGGMICWDAERLRKIRSATRDRGIPLIADEVFTGFGRTGCVFACEHGPIEPDILCVSKALTGGYLPLAATLASDEIFGAFLSDDRARAFFHGHSYTGNALGCAVALESLAIFDETDRLGRVGELESRFRARLDHLDDHPLVSETRGIGGVAALELKPETRGGYLDDRGPRITRRLLDAGIFLRPLGNVLYFVPPYVITDDEVEWVFDAIARELDAAMHESPTR